MKYVKVPQISYMEFVMRRSRKIIYMRIDTSMVGTFKGFEEVSVVNPFNVYLKQLEGQVFNKIGNISLMRQIETFDLINEFYYV